MFSSNECFTMPVVPAGYNSGNNGMFGGDGAWFLWFIVIIALFGGWGFGGYGGFGGFGGGINTLAGQGYATRADINEEFAFNNINRDLQGISSTLRNGISALQAAILDCCCQTREAISGVNYNMAMNANATQRAIDGVNYNLATQACDTRNLIQSTTRDIIDNQNAGTRAILDFLTNDKIASLTAENQSLKFAASQSEQNAFIAANQSAQTAELIRRLGADCPTPAYVVQPPTPVNFPTNCCGQYTGYNACGCGC